MPNGSGGNVVIDASLNASAMESAINILVADVDYKMNKLAEKFDENITKMENSMGRMKKTSKNVNIEQNAQEMQSVSHLGESYDKLASSMQAAAQSAKRWDVSQIQSLRMELHGLESEMSRLGKVSWNQGYDEWMRVGRQIDETRAKIQQLTQEQERLKSMPTANRFEEQQRLQQYQQLGVQIDALKRKEAELVATHSRTITEFSRETPAGKQFQQVRAQYDAVQQKIRDMGASMTQEASLQTQKTQELEKQEQLLQRQVESSRKISENTMRSSGTGTFEIGPITQVTPEELQRITQAREAENAALQKEVSLNRELSAAQAQTNQKKPSFSAYDDMRTAIASVLNMERDQIRIADQTYASYNRLNLSLGQMTEAYHRLNSEERKSGMGKNLANEIQMTKRAMQQLQEQMTRPVSLKAALGLSENTLSDIEYKLRQLSSYRAGIKITDPKQVQEINQVNQAIDSLNKKKNELIGNNEKVVNSNNALTRSFNYMKNRLAFYFTVGASTQFVKNLIEVRAQYELLEKSIGILVGSMQEGSRIFSELNAMAIKSPFTTMELGAAAKQLTAYDVAAKDVVNTTKRLADMAAAVGVPIERLSYALGQVKAYDYLNARDARMFANAGIPLVRELANYYTELEGKMVSVGDVYSRMKKRMISYNDTMAVVNKMTDEGGKFFNFQEKMAGTLKVQLANLTLEWNNMLNAIGKQNQGIITAPIKGLKTLFKYWNQISSVLRDVALTYGLVKIGQIAYVMWTANGTTATKLAAATNWKFVNSLVAMRNGLVALMSNPLTWITALVGIIVSASMAFLDARDALHEFNKAIRESSQQNVENITSFLKDYKEIRDQLSSGNDKDVSEEDVTKAWEALKEQIELTSGASDIFISNLMSIPNINDRVRASFNYLETVRAVAYALEKIDDETIKINNRESSFADVFAAGNTRNLYQRVSRYTESLSDLNKKMEESGKTMEEIPNRVSKSLKGLTNSLDETYESMMQFAKDKNWLGNPDAINEFSGQMGKKIVQEGLDKGWQPQDVLNFQLEFEGYRSKAAKEALEQRVKNELDTYKNTEDSKTRVAIKAQIDRDKAQLNNWEQNNGRGRILWNEFTEWLTNTHDTQVRNMYNKMTQNGTQALDYSSKEWKSFVNDMADKFAKENKLSQDDTFNNLRKWVNDANKMKIFIELIIGTGTNKSLYETLTDLDKAANDAYTKQKRLTERLNDVNAKINIATQQKDYNSLNALYDEREKLIKEQTAAQEEFNKATARGGKSSAAEAEAKKAAAAANKANNATKREQKKAEDAVAKALSQELSVIKEMQSNYDKLRKAGVNTTDALTIASSGYDKTLKSINATLSKFGISNFKAEDFVGSGDPHKLLNALTKQLNTLMKSGKVKTSSLKDLEVEIQKITVEAKEYDMKKITDGLNNELSKIKEEYELGVELDANPELGAMFAEAFGIDTEKLPKTVQEAIDRMQESVDKSIAEATFGEGIDIDPEDLMNQFDILHDDIDEWAKRTGQDITSDFKDSIRKTQKEARDLVTKETRETIKDWEKLLEKYSENEVKKKQIQQKAEKEREIARKMGAKKEIFDAIDLMEKREYAQLDFNEFQKSAEWITATGDLSKLTSTALQILIEKLLQYKNSAKYLDPKQIKKVNDAIRKMYKELRKNNPFAAISLSIQESAERMELFEPDIEDLENKIKTLQDKWWEQGGWLTAEDEEKLEEYNNKLRELIELQNEAGKQDSGDWIGDLSKYTKAARSISDSFKEIADSIGDEGLKKAADITADIVGNFEAAEKGAETWGGWWGAIIGGVTDMIPKIIKWASGDNSIVEKIKDSQVAVKNLELAYKQLEYATEKAFGTAKYGAQQALIANKKLQLAQLEYQLQLEESRDSKNRDEEAILSLKGEIIDLRHEIANTTDEIVNDLLGISSVGDFAENLVKSMIEAFKSGEDYMKVFEDSFEDMIDNMIMKAIVSRLIGDFVNQIFDQVKATKVESEDAKSAQAKIDALTKKKSKIDQAIEDAESFMEYAFPGERLRLKKYLEQLYAKRDSLDKQMNDAINEYNNAIAPTPEDVNEIRDMVADGKQGVMDGFKALMDMFGIEFGQDKENAKLSALQQGIQGITEDTAGALEAYMNGVSQQVYLHSDLLTQIRDILVNFGGDVTIATNAQILLQLQQSFQVQMTIQNVLTGVLNASGLAFRVELAN